MQRHHIFLALFLGFFVEATTVSGMTHSTKKEPDDHRISQGFRPDVDPTPDLTSTRPQTAQDRLLDRLPLLYDPTRGRHYKELGAESASQGRWGWLSWILGGKTEEEQDRENLVRELERQLTEQRSLLEATTSGKERKDYRENIRKLEDALVKNKP